MSKEKKTIKVKVKRVQPLKSKFGVYLYDFGARRKRKHIIDIRV